MRIRILSILLAAAMLIAGSGGVVGAQPTDRPGTNESNPAATNGTSQGPPSDAPNPTESPTATVTATPSPTPTDATNSKQPTAVEGSEDEWFDFDFNLTEYLFEALDRANETYTSLKERLGLE